jgi:hypothetical protein
LIGLEAVTRPREDEGVRRFLAASGDYSALAPYGMQIIILGQCWRRSASDPSMIRRILHWDRGCGFADSVAVTKPRPIVSSGK